MAGALWYVAGGAVCLLLLAVMRSLLGGRRIKLKGLTVVITGGSSGMGLALAEEAASQGANVYILARRQEVLEEALVKIAKHCQNDDQTIDFRVADVCNDASVQKSMKSIIKDTGAIDILICCAGVSRATLFEDLPAKAFDQVLAVNVSGCANCARAVVPHMKRRRQGRICFISSVAGQLGVFGYGAYSASKFALRGLGEVLAMELKPYNVGISLSFPPDMNTPMFEQENKEKPWECHQISGKVEMQQPEVAARATWDGIRSNKFFISHSFDGVLLNWLTAGAAPVRTLGGVIGEILMMGLTRFIFCFYLVSFDRICKAGAKRRDAAAADKNKDE